MLYRCIYTRRDEHKFSKRHRRLSAELGTKRVRTARGRGAMWINVFINALHVTLEAKARAMDRSRERRGCRQRARLPPRPGSEMGADRETGVLRRGAMLIKVLFIHLRAKRRALPASEPFPYSEPFLRHRSDPRTKRVRTARATVETAGVSGCDAAVPAQPHHGYSLVTTIKTFKGLSDGEA